MSIEINGQLIDTDAQGYLRQLSDWSEALATALAAKDGVTLNADHWQIIHLIRDYYADTGKAPAVCVIIRQAKKRLGDDKGNSKHVYQLFPDGPGKQGVRYAGLPKPTGCL